MQIVIDIPEEDYKFLKESDGCRWSRAILEGIINGTPLPKGHGRIVDENKITSFGWNNTDNHAVVDAPTIIEADKKYEVEIITRGNCMMCGKELTEGLFFCKECEEKGESEVRE